MFEETEKNQWSTMERGALDEIGKKSMID